MNMNKKIDGFTLKMIAICTMFIDHCGAVIFERLLTASYMGQNPWGAAHIGLVSSIYLLLRGIGRLAFPIYCFLLVEGLMHTRSVSKYLLRLGIFAVISELPFDICFNNTLMYDSPTKLLEWSYNNVFLTLFFGLLVVALMKCIDDRMQWKGAEETIESTKYRLYGLGKLLLKMLVLFAGMALAEVVFHTDYGAAGIAAIGAIYLLYRRPKIAVFAAVVILALLTSGLEAMALIDVLFIAMYNGERGKNSKGLKWFFYIFYPAHLLVIQLIAMAVGLPY